MPKPLVSVIIAVKDGERYLVQAIESVLAQSATALELVVEDGQLCDRTHAIAQSYAPVRLVSQAGRGLGDAWNQGLAAAKGELIAFLDHDDLWAEDKLRRQLACFATHPQLQYVIGHMRFFLEPGYAVPSGFKAELLSKEVIGRVPGTLLARAALFRLIGGFDEALQIAADVDWFARVKDARAPAAIVPAILLHKRVHGANLSSQAGVNNRELLSLLRQSIRRQREHIYAAS